MDALNLGGRTNEDGLGNYKRESFQLASRYVVQVNLRNSVSAQMKGTRFTRHVAKRLVRNAEPRLPLTSDSHSY